MKKLSIDELRAMISSAITKVTDMFTQLLGRSSDKDNKRAALLSYWIKDYTAYVLNEDNFDPKKMIRYKRGNIIQVEFGYRVGKELGGRHFAVVLDNKNDFSSDLITVVPLGSLKEGYKESRFSFQLENGVYELYEQKIKRQIEELNKRIEETNDEMVSKAEELENDKISNDEYLKYVDQAKKLLNELKNRIQDIEKAKIKLSKLKSGSVINLGQIITVSKMRVSDPKINSDTLYGLKLSRNDLDKLNEKLSKLYFFQRDNQE